ncbi:MAG: DUF87 domain-containing protein [Verrucomicrobiaceae bacterium]|nr:DUF87 domain-containing protein [Verrucomicrobiaceae bacterium]
MTHIYLGQRVGYAGVLLPCYFDTAHLTRHVHVLGKTGMGKSTLLRAIMSGLLEHSGFCLLDPHGDLARWALDVIPPHRLGDVIFLDAADPEYAPALNLVSSAIPEAHRPRVASALLSSFRHLWAESWGPRLEYILYHSLRTLLDAGNVSLIALPRLLVDESFRLSIVKQCRDPFIRSFWSTEYDAWDKRFRQEAIAPIQNKLGQLAALPQLRHIFGQVKLRVDFAEVLREGRIVIVNLAKGNLGEDAARIIGSLLVSSLCSAAMERGASNTNERRDFTLILDEAQSFLSDALVSVLSESRKFGLGIVLCHQYFAQLPPAIQTAVLGNVGSTFAFRVSGDDAEVLAKHYGTVFSPSGFIEAAPFTALVRPVDSVGYPFRLLITSANNETRSNANRVRDRSRQQYCSLRSEVERKLSKWIIDSCF